MRDIKIRFSQFKGELYSQFEQSLNFKIVNIKFDQNHYPCQIKLTQQNQNILNLFDELKLNQFMRSKSLNSSLKEKIISIICRKYQIYHSKIFEDQQEKFFERTLGFTEVQNGLTFSQIGKQDSQQSDYDYEAIINFNQSTNLIEITISKKLQLSLQSFKDFSLLKSSQDSKKVNRSFHNQQDISIELSKLPIKEKHNFTLTRGKFESPEKQEILYQSNRRKHKLSMDTLLFKRVKQSLGADEDLENQLKISKINDLKIQEKQTLDNKSNQIIEKLSLQKKFKNLKKKQASAQSDKRSVSFSIESYEEQSLYSDLEMQNFVSSSSDNLSSNSDKSQNNRKNKTKKSYRSRDESSISCMQDIENMMNENQEKKKN